MAEPLPPAVAPAGAGHDDPPQAHAAGAAPAAQSTSGDARDASGSQRAPGGGSTPRAAAGASAMAGDQAEPASAATPVTGPTAVRWEARIEAIRRLIDTDPVTGGAQAASAAEEARAESDIRSESGLLYLAGIGWLRRKRPVEAALHFHRGLSLAQVIGRVELEAHQLSGLGSAHSLMGDFSAAIDCFERALSLQQALPHGKDGGRARAKLLNHLGVTLAQMGRPDQALLHFRQACEHYLRLGEAKLAATCLGNWAEAHSERAERLSWQSSSPLRREAIAAARAARDLAEQVVADPAVPAGDAVSINARVTIVRALAVLGDCAAALEELNRLDQHLTSAAHRAFFKVDRQILRARLLRLSGRASDAVAELQADAPDDLPGPDHVRVLEERVAAQEAAGDLSGALASFRRYHELTLQARDQSAEQRGQVLHARLELERAHHKAEIERLRAEQLVLRNDELARQAHIDALTGLPNRRGLDAALAHRIGDERAQFACVLADIDHFKRINDRYSHLVGDEVLRRVGALMREAVRDGDLAARYGGEEFALLLDRVDGRQALEVCERLRTTIAAQPWGQIVAGLAVTISLGVVMRQAGDSGEALLGRADGCLYAAKAAGRDRVMVDAAARSAPPAAG